MLKILVVDDNAVNRQLLVTLLRFEGYETVEAVDGADGLEVARRERPRLIITDIVMPTMDGYEFVRQIRADPVLATTAVIFHTAHFHEREARTLANSCQVARVLTKPCESREVLRAVQETLQGKEQAPAAAPTDGFEQEHLRVLTNKLVEKSAELSTSNARLTALSELNLQLALERDSKVLLAKVCAGARELVASKYAALAVGGADHAYPLIVATSGLPVTPVPAEFPRNGEGLLGRVLLERRPRNLRLPNDDLAELGLSSSFPPAEAILAVPLMSLKRCYGWLLLANKLGADGFSAEDEQVLRILGAQVGRIYENGSLYREVQEQATKLLLQIAENERATAELRDSEERFRQLTENIQDVFFLITADLQQLLYVSPSYAEIWGRSFEPTKPLAWLETVHGDDQARVQSALESLRRRPDIKGELEFRIVRGDGSLRWILGRVFRVAASPDKAARLAGVAVDITERKQAQDKIEHLNRVHLLLSGISSLIVRVNERIELIREVCRLAVEHGEFRQAWCGLYDPGTGKLITSVQAGEGFEHGSVPTTSSYPPADSVVAEAMSTLHPIICNELRTTTQWIRNRDALLAGGSRALAALPLAIDGRAVGCFILTATEPGFFDAEEIRLLTEVAGDLSLALDHIEKAERLNYLAYYDGLTGLANRTLFLERLALHIGVASENQTRVAVVVADPERLGSVNSSMGRSTGDELLRLIGQRFASSLGETDRVGRVGSDQFAAVIPRIEEDSAIPRILDEWWIRWLQEPFLVAERPFAVVAKAGVAMFPTDGQDAESVLRCAEAALNTAKKLGEPYAFYTPHLGERLAERFALESDMRRALEREDFVLHYQPKVDLTTRRVTGLEALIRWRHATLGLIPPAKFIPLLEETGMIVEVGSWVLRQAILDRSKWFEAGLNAPRVAINVSTVQLQRENYVRSFSNLLKLSGPEPGIDIEVTESVLMSNVAENMSKLMEIRDLGVHIALDDFGTGYSSMAYLTRLPVQTLKVDRSFVTTMGDDPDAMTLISTIISLAHTLRMETVAEGVETEEQAKFLRLLRCDQMQGYLISRPMPFDDMTAWLSRSTDDRLVR